MRPRRAALRYVRRDVIAERAPAVRDAARDHRQAVALLALCAVLWSSAGVLIKLVDWNAGAIWSTRSAIAATVLWLWRRPSVARVSAAAWRGACSLAATTRSEEGRVGE